jgi:hypothetical protein
MFSIFCKNKPFDDVTREDFLCFLDMFRKPESIDPMHMWVGTYKWMDGETARARSKLLKMHGIHAIQSM